MERDFWSISSISETLNSLRDLKDPLHHHLMRQFLPLPCLELICEQLVSWLPAVPHLPQRTPSSLSVAPMQVSFLWAQVSRLYGEPGRQIFGQQC